MDETVMRLPAVFDLYVLGGPDGFYVGQAKHKRGGGWERRVAAHRLGKGSKRAQQLLAHSALARCIGTVRAEQDYINELEARAWDVRVAQGWKSMHARPQDATGWIHCQPHTPEARAKMHAAATDRSPEVRAAYSAAARKLWQSPEYREKRLRARHAQRSSGWSRPDLAELNRSRRGIPMSTAVRQKISAAHQGKPKPWVSAALRGRPKSPECRAKLSAALLGHPVSAEARAKMSAASRGRRLSDEHRAKISAAGQGRKVSAAAIAKRRAWWAVGRKRDGVRGKVIR